MPKTATQPPGIAKRWPSLLLIDKVSEVMDGVEEELLADLDDTEQCKLEGLLTAIWERRGGYEELATATAEDDEAA